MTKKKTKKAAVPSRARIKMSPGEMLRTIRELQEMSQADLAEASNIPQPTISAIEGGRAKLGDVRAERLARALKVHPAVLLWPDWEEAADAGDPSESSDVPVRVTKSPAQSRKTRAA